MQAQTIAVASIFVALFIGFVAATHIGLQKQERLECQKWELEADKYSGYFIAEWQKEQCDSFGTQIEAPVIPTEIN